MQVDKGKKFLDGVAIVFDVEGVGLSYVDEAVTIEDKLNLHYSHYNFANHTFFG